MQNLAILSCKEIVNLPVEKILPNPYQPRKVFDEKALNEIYGIISNKEKIEFIKQLISKNVSGLLEKMEQFFQTGIDIKRLTTDLIDILKDVVIYKNTKDYYISTSEAFLV